MDYVMHLTVRVYDSNPTEILDVKKHIEQYSYTNKVIIVDNFTTQVDY